MGAALDKTQRKLQKSRMDKKSVGKGGRGRKGVGERRIPQWGERVLVELEVKIRGQRKV